MLRASQLATDGAVGDLPSPALIAIFIGAGVITWVAGIALSRTTDALDLRLGLGEALGGVILLAVSGSLPEVAITVSAVLQGHLDVAAGNLIGGIAIQTMVLVLCDRAVGGDHPLTYLVGSRNEGYGETGMAHLLEHMQFKGTPRHRHPSEEISGHGASSSVLSPAGRVQ